MPSSLHCKKLIVTVGYNEYKTKEKKKKMKFWKQNNCVETTLTLKCFENCNTNGIVGAFFLCLLKLKFVGCNGMLICGRIVFNIHMHIWMRCHTGIHHSNSHMYYIDMYKYIDRMCYTTQWYSLRISSELSLLLQIL